MIAHLLDVRLAQLAKQNQLTYSRYADDLTFSTSQRTFPTSVAAPITEDSPQWAPGEGLVKAIEKAGFVINPNKTRMQFRMSRQLVTGLTVNTKVNIRPEYYRWARAMCHTLFATGSYYRPVDGAPESEGDINGEPELVTSLYPLEGILSHIHHVKDTIDERDEPEKRKNATAARRLYARFLKYRYFVRLEHPLIVCEGKTDSIYLKHDRPLHTPPARGMRLKPHPSRRMGYARASEGPDRDTPDSVGRAPLRQSYAGSGSCEPNSHYAELPGISAVRLRSLAQGLARYDYRPHS